MENSNQQEMVQAISEDKSYYVSTHFESDEAMKAYYLQMAETMNTSVSWEKNSDYTSLKKLHQKISQQCGVLQHLTQHEWGSGIIEIQDICGSYLLQSKIDRKKLIQTNREIALHLQFIIQLAGNAGYIKQMLNNLQQHYQNVEYLIKKTKETTEEVEV